MPIELNWSLSYIRLLHLSQRGTSTDSSYSLYLVDMLSVCCFFSYDLIIIRIIIMCSSATRIKSASYSVSNPSPSTIHALTLYLSLTPYGVKNDTLHCGDHTCHRAKLLKSGHVVKRQLIFACVWVRPVAKTCLGDVIKPTLTGIRRGLWPLARFRVEHPPIRFVAGSWECICYSFIPTPSCLDLCVVLQFRELVVRGCRKHRGFPCTFLQLFAKWEGFFMRV